MTQPRGAFIAFEGGEAAGKSTQASRLARRLDALLTYEPGATDVGQRIRALFLDPDVGAIDERAEALMVAADRAHHVATRIRPALDAGRHVVTDRFTGSTLAYQGYGRGLPVAELQVLCDWATAGLAPDVVVLLQVPLDAAASRMSDSPDRMEAAGDEFHQRVSDGFDRLATDLAWAVVDGVGSPDEVERRVWAAVSDRLPHLG